MFLIFRTVNDSPDYGRDCVIESFQVKSLKGFVAQLRQQSDCLECWKDEGTYYIDHTSGGYVAFRI